MYDNLFAFLARSGLEPSQVATDEAIVAGHGPQLATDLLNAAADIDGPIAWGRISYRYLAGQRVHAVIAGTQWWDQQRSWPPPHVPADLPDEIATLTELISLLDGNGVELTDPPVLDRSEWARALPLLARLEPLQPLDEPEELAERYNAIEIRLGRASATLEEWLATGPHAEPGAELWGFLEDIGGTEGVIDRPGALLENPVLQPQMRGAVTALMDADAIGGVDELRVAHALGIITSGNAAYNVAQVEPTLHHVPFIEALGRLREFLALVPDPAT